MRQRVARARRRRQPKKKRATARAIKRRAWQLAVFTEFVLLCRDVPYLSLLALNGVFFWRVPIVARALAALDDEAPHARQLTCAAEQLGRSLASCAAAAVALPLLFTWRGRAVFAHARARGLHDLAPAFVFGQAGALLCDVPFVLLSPLCAWRLRSSSRVSSRRGACRSRPPTAQSPRSRCARRATSARRTRTGDGGLDGHGVAIRLRGAKPARLAVERATLEIDGDAFWAALERIAGASLVAFFRATMHPLALIPRFWRDGGGSRRARAGDETVDATLAFGCGPAAPKVSHATMRRVLGKLAATGDAPATVSVVAQFGGFSIGASRC